MQVVHGPCQQPGTHQQGHRKCELQARQEPAPVHPAHPAGGAAALFLKTRSRVGFGNLPRRQKAEQQLPPSPLSPAMVKTTQRIQREAHSEILSVRTIIRTSAPWIR